ncbi:MAG: 30S ribosomal protein S6e [Desulfurococcales archaeon]|nr:30S ribosomal protein S6e [Desulfurococcales archaeon]MCE4622185.1 30S ribosomal protein S6e [Desulfurococcales archaeon]MCE4629762.1 30S ribosomal protein S6e [Desulfurococcales archaeon]NOZ31298.1 30S ribosomal protein S6e [Thermoproteota archaeon]
MAEEAPPLRVVISDPKGGRKIVKVKVKGVEDEQLEYTDEMRREKEKGRVRKERSKLPLAKLNSKLAKELELDDKVGVITIRFKTEDEKINETFKVIIDDNVPDGEIHVNMEHLGELVGDLEKEGEAFRAKAWQIAIPQKLVERLAGLEIGDVFEGTIIGLPGVRLKIRGGSDATGFPMHPGVPGSAKRKILLAGPPGFKPREKGERRRKTVRGRMIPDPRGERRKTVLAQLNVVIHYE